MRKQILHAISVTVAALNAYLQLFNRVLVIKLATNIKMSAGDIILNQVGLSANTLQQDMPTLIDPQYGHSLVTWSESGKDLGGGGMSL